MSDPCPVTTYYQQLHQFKESLFRLYRNEHLGKKIVPRGNGWTWGYRLLVNGQSTAGSSIGEDELKLFFDVLNLIRAEYSYSVGVAFGFSLFCLALARPDHMVYGIDNYSRSAGPMADYTRELVERIIRENFNNVSLYVGTSPEDVPACLESLPQGKKLSLVFIDGYHSDSAAKADYSGAEPFMDQRTVVFWHNTYSVARAFRDCFNKSLFDRCYVLRTYGVLGVYFHAGEHPQLEEYLRDNCLVWEDWVRHLSILEGQKSRVRLMVSWSRSLARRIRRVIIHS